MKQYGLIEPSIMECRRAKSYIRYRNGITALLVAMVVFVIYIAVESIVKYDIGLIAVSSYLGVVIGLIIFTVIQFRHYHIEAKTTVLAITRHFILSHQESGHRTYDVMCPVTKIDSIHRYKSWIDKSANSITVVIYSQGRIHYYFRHMDINDVEKFLKVYQKIMTLPESSTNN